MDPTPKNAQEWAIDVAELAVKRAEAFERYLNYDRHAVRGRVSYHQVQNALNSWQELEDKLDRSARMYELAKHHDKEI